MKDDHKNKNKDKHVELTTLAEFNYSDHSKLKA